MNTVFFRWIKADDIATQKWQTDKMTFAQKSSWVTCRRQVGLIENAPNDTIRQLRQNLLKLSRIQWCKIWLFLSIFTLKSLLIFRLSLDTVISEKCGFHLCKTCWKLLLHQQKNQSTAWFVSRQNFSFAISVAVQRVRLIEICTNYSLKHLSGVSKG